MDIVESLSEDEPVLHDNDPTGFRGLLAWAVRTSGCMDVSGDLPQRGRVRRVVCGLPEVHMIKRVVCLRADLKCRAFAFEHVLVQSSIHIGSGCCVFRRITLSTCSMMSFCSPGLSAILSASPDLRRVIPCLFIRLPNNTNATASK